MPFTFRQGDLPKLDLQVDRGSDFTAWQMQWESYRSLSGLDKESAAKQIQALTLCFSRDTLSIVQNLGLTEEQKGSVDETIHAIKRYIDGHINETVERRNFRQRYQHPGEPFDDFLVSLRDLVKTCNFCSDACVQKSLRDQIIEGLLDGDTIEALLQEVDLTLERAISKCRAQEAAKRQRANITDHSESVAALHEKSRDKRGNAPLTPASPQCPGCGAKPHPGGRSQCPAYGQSCHNCQKIGHYAKVCRGKFTRRRDPPSPPTVNTLQIKHHTLSNIRNVASTDPAPLIPINVTSLHGSITIKVLPDSGADISAAGTEILCCLNEHANNLLPSRIIPRAVNGAKMHPLGKLPVKLQLGDKEYCDDFHIYPNIQGALISWKACKQLHILPECYPHPITHLDKLTITTTSPELTKVTKTLTKAPLLSPEYAKDQCPTIFDGQIRSMEGEKFHISLTDDAKPFCVNTPRSIPFAYRDKLKAELDLLQSQHIIAPVVEVTEWCAPIVVTPKKNTDRIRMCVDLSRLNRYVRREWYQSSTPAEAVADIAASSAKVFTVLDAMKGYHQCPLDENSQLLTTFITPYGRFKYLRAPYGISSISEHYDRRMAEAFTGLTGFRRIVDDIVIYDSDPQQHTAHVMQFLQRCADKHIALNFDKCKFCQTEVTFAGFRLSTQGYQVDHSITDAISEFPKPSNRTELRSFFGLVNQLSSSTSDVASLLTPLRPLLSTKNDFIWSGDHDHAFKAAKDSLTVAPILSYFDATRPSRLCTDASRHGLGFILQQRTPEGTWTLIQAGSRFLTDTESRYAVIELELLAVCWAVCKCKLFLAGLQHFTVVTDHNPLIPIMNSHRLDEIENPRLQRLKTKLMAYNFTAEWLKGTKNDAPDALSRNPVSDPQPHELLAELDVDNNPDTSFAEIRSVTNESLRLQDLRKHSDQDSEYQHLKNFILNGFPSRRNQLPETCKCYWNVRDHLTLDDDLIVNGCRLLIPRAMRHQVLSQLHESHQGSVRTKQRARLSVYWPGIDNDIDNTILSCQQCQDCLPSNTKEPLIQKPKPDRPFQEIAVDLCTYAGHDYLIVVDCYTDWPAILPMDHDTTTPKLITALRQSFCRTAIPDVLWSDGGPQFTSNKFKDFSQQWGFLHNISTPHYPQSNGKIEATVKSMKKIIRSSWNGRFLDDDKFCRALLQYRNTPSRKDGISPAQKLYGHPVQDILPAHRRSFLQEWQQKSQDVEEQAKQTLQSSETFYNTHAHPLPDIHIGSNVAIQNSKSKLWDIYGIVTDISPHRKYYVKTSSGRVLVRNRRFLRRRIPLSIPTSHQQPNPAATSHQDPSTLRHSNRTKQPTNRLIEDPNWH